MEKLVSELNKQAVSLARQAVKEILLEDSSRSCFIAGAMGPTNKTTSLSPDVNDPAYRVITFEQLSQTYYEQAQALVEAGVDILLVETIFDTLNAKAAFFAIDQLFEEKKQKWPLMISATITDASGRTLSGQTIEAFWCFLKHTQL